MISNLIGIVVVAIVLIALAMVGRGMFNAFGDAQLFSDAGITLQLEPGPVRIVVHGTYRTTVTGGPRTNRYRAVLSAGALEVASNAFTITVSQDTKIRTERNTTTALEATIERAGNYSFRLDGVAGNPIEFTRRSLTIR